MEQQQSNKPHHKAKEKKTKDKSSGPNPKAFAYNAPGRLKKQATRSHEIKEKRLHVPLVDRLPEEPPPVVVAVVGPPGVGKTTLIKSLVRRYTKHTLSAPAGPLTVVASRKRRLTLLEVPADAPAAQLDAAKIADLVLLLIDGNYGFEMETMEFLHALQAHGMPGSVFGVLTHLDLFRRPGALRDAKKRLKQRFWTELYPGAKLFYLSGVLNGRYPDREIHNLSRFIATMKSPRPLVWRNAHPYCLADRFLDVTPPAQIEADPKCDRLIALYGYLRGTNFPVEGARVHVPGVGDLSVSLVEALPDPCPTPQIQQARARAAGQPAPRRRLGEKQKLLFAPMSDVGGVLVDKDAVYIDVKTATFDKDGSAAGRERGPGEQMVVDLQAGRRLLGEAAAGVRLFEGGQALAPQSELEDRGRTEKRVPRFADLNGDAGEDGEDGMEHDGEDTALSDPNGFLSMHPSRRSHIQNGVDAPVMDEMTDSGSDVVSDVGSADENSGSASDDDHDDEGSDIGQGDDDDVEESALRWKSNLSNTAAQAFARRRAFRVADFARLLYDESVAPADVVRQMRGKPTSQRDTNGVSDQEDDNFFRKTDNDDSENLYDGETVPSLDYEALERKWTDPGELETLRERFATARLSNAAAEDVEAADGSGSDAADESEGDGDFEDLEAPDVDGKTMSNGAADDAAAIDAERERNARRKEELKLRFEEEDREGLLNDKSAARREQDGDAEAFGEDDWYEAQKAEIQKQLAINRAELARLEPTARVRVEGHSAGTYARLVLENVPCEFAQHFNPRFPILVGGLSATEERFGLVHARVKRHRWHKRILKTQDPLIISLGWRRFQTLPVYSLSDNRMRQRMIKYTPEHMHCFATFYGPLVAPATGLCAVQSLVAAHTGFRVAATGVVLSVDAHVELVKKIKLTGHPYKIFRNTAFIKDMFASALEIAKFEGAAIRTVSGVRGQVKRALSKPDGHFRATFEDKVLLSDIVFLRAWTPVHPPRFYNPVTNLLGAGPAAAYAATPNGPQPGPAPVDASEDPAWPRMRLTGEVRAAQQLPVPTRANSSYRPIERPAERRFNPLRVPRQLAAELPFASQIARMRPQARPTYLQRRAVVLGGEERRARALLAMVATLRRAKEEKRAASRAKKREVWKQGIAEREKRRRGREKREKEEYWRKEGRKRAREGGGAAGGAGGGKRRKT